MINVVNGLDRKASGNFRWIWKVHGMKRSKLPCANDFRERRIYSFRTDLRRSSAFCFLREEGGPLQLVYLSFLWTIFDFSGWNG